MRLLSAQVQNYRVHRDCSVAFDGDLVLIHGPNESGKSTLAEAVHCALFLKAKGSTSLHAGMQSEHGGDPVVRIEFEAGGRRHTLVKRFGARGLTTLRSEGQATLNGADAETALTSLLGVDGTLSGRGIEDKMKQRWAHLWVWQGESNRSPIDSLGETNDKLRERLQTGGGRTITSSPLDARVIQNLQNLVDATLTSTGRTKAGSELARAEEALGAAKEALSRKRETLDLLRQAAESYEQASSDQARYAASLADSEQRLKAIEKQLITVREHREKLREKTREREDLSRELERLKKNDADIRRLNAELEAARKEAAPGEAEVKRLSEECEEDKSARDASIQAREAAGREVSRSRNLHDALLAQVNVLRTGTRIASLEKQMIRVRRLKEEQQALRKRLAPLDPFTSKALGVLRKKSVAAAEARARVDAFALQLEVLESDQEITVGGDVLATGEKKTLAHAAELRVGKKTRLRISPGGADDLQAARDDSRKADEDLAAALRALNAASLEEAETKLRERAALEGKLETVQERLREQEADGIEAQLDEARLALARHESGRDHLAEKAGLPTMPDSLQAAEADQTKAAESLRAAEQREQEALATEKASRGKFEKTEKRLQAARDRHQRAQEHARDLNSKLEFAIGSSGDSDSRTKAILQLEGRYDQALAAEKAETDALGKLGADQLELDQQRLAKSVESDRRNRANAGERLTIARTELKSNGSTDPEREYKELEAGIEQLQRRHDALRHQADVRVCLLNRLKAARKATTEALARPLEDKVRPYLQFLFGGSHPKLHWAEDGSRLESFELDRTGRRGGVHDFNSLSHGTREQVGLALRLAMAELLAADHDNCLPVVLDDAFTHADRDRLENLKSLLFQATRNGLQILLLSCHPENYGGLGAAEVALAAPPPVPTSPAPAATTSGNEAAHAPSFPAPTVPTPEHQPGTAAGTTAEPAAEPAAGTTAGPSAASPAAEPGSPEARLLEALDTLGGQAGNRKLRDTLGWDELYYTQVRKGLIEKGLLVTGRGRGGSVRAVPPQPAAPIATDPSG
ncbi:MAG: AAA family ATPase [Puniceicoccaceae bacterium]